MKRKLMAGLIVVVVIVAAMMFSGCVGEEQKMSVSEIKAMVLANAKEIDAYKFDMNTTTRTLLSNETNSTEMTTLINGRGVVDIIDKEMKLNMNTSMETNETEEDCFLFFCFLNRKSTRSKFNTCPPVISIPSALRSSIFLSTPKQ